MDISGGKKVQHKPPPSARALGSQVVVIMSAAVFPICRGIITGMGGLGNRENTCSFPKNQIYYYFWWPKVVQKATGLPALYDFIVKRSTMLRTRAIALKVLRKNCAFDIHSSGAYRA